MINLKWYNEVSESGGEYRRLPPNGYVCRIVRAELGEWNKRPQIRVYIDIAEGEYEGYFREQNRERWSNNAIFKRFIFDETDGKITPALKSLAENVKRSNAGYTFNLERFDERSLVGKLCGFVFGEREYVYNEKTRVTTEVRYPVSVEKIRAGDFKISPIQKLKPPPQAEQVDNGDSGIQGSGEAGSSGSNVREPAFHWCRSLQDTTLPEVRAYKPPVWGLRQSREVGGGRDERRGICGRFSDSESDGGEVQGSGTAHGT